MADALALTAGTSLSVILSNSLPAAAVALGASGADLAGFSAAALVSRIPLFFAGLGQAIVVPRVASATGTPQTGAEESDGSSVRSQLSHSPSPSSSACSRDRSSRWRR